MNAVTIALALVIGASLGLVGGGGSILTVPALVHAGGFAPREADAWQRSHFAHAHEEGASGADR